MIRINKILSATLYNKETGEVIGTYNAPPCEMFESCGCKTAACRVCPPDESCYWYRYFKKIIKENETREEI